MLVLQYPSSPTFKLVWLDTTGTINANVSSFRPCDGGERVRVCEREIYDTSLPSYSLDSIVDLVVLLSCHTLNVVDCIRLEECTNWCFISQRYTV